MSVCVCEVSLPAGAVRSGGLPARQPAVAAPGGADEALTSTSPFFLAALADLCGALSAG